jgi:replicative DNA helicase
MNDSKKDDQIILLSSRELMKQCFRDIEYTYSRKHPKNFIPTYSKGLDGLMLGLHQSDLIVVAGKPGAGKSAFVHNVINHVASEKHPVLLCSPEMSKNVVTLRLLSTESEVSFKRLACGELGEKDWPGITTAAGRLSEFQIHIDNALPLPISRITQMAHELKNKSKLDLLVIDSMPFIVTDENQSNVTTVDIIMALKALARDLKIPVILTLPLKADAPDQSATYPSLSDIKEDSIVNMADVIILLHKTKAPNKKICKIDAIVAKNRNGVQGVALFQFFGECLSFAEIPEKKQTTLDMD